MRFLSALSALLLAFATGLIAGLSTSPVGTTLVTGLGILVLASLGVRGLSIDPLKKFIVSPDSGGNPTTEPPKTTDAGPDSGANPPNPPPNRIVASPTSDNNPTIPSLTMLALSFGLLSGVWLGIVARTHLWLAPSPTAVLLRYKNPELRDAEILRALMHAELGVAPGALAVPYGRGGVLFASESPQVGCAELIKKSKDTLTAQDLISSGHPVFKVLGDILRLQDLNRNQLNALVAGFCPEGTQ